MTWTFTKEAPDGSCKRSAPPGEGRKYSVALGAILSRCEGNTVLLLLLLAHEHCSPNRQQLVSCIESLDQAEISLQWERQRQPPQLLLPHDPRIDSEKVETLSQA